MNLNNTWRIQREVGGLFFQKLNCINITSNCLNMDIFSGGASNPSFFSWENNKIFIWHLYFISAKIPRNNPPPPPPKKPEKNPAQHPDAARCIA